MTEETCGASQYPAIALRHDDCEYRYQEWLEMVAFSGLSLEELKRIALEEYRIGGIAQP